MTGMIIIGVLIVFTIGYCIASSLGFNYVPLGWRSNFYKISLFGMGVAGTVSICYIVYWVVGIISGGF